MKILVVDDDRVLADLIAFALRREGFEPIQAHDGASALRRWREEQPAAALLDVNLPDTTGFNLCERIRAESDIPILMLTVRGEDDDVVRGLQLGADDYIVKPFSPRQLVARLHAVLRRAKTPAAPARQQVGNLQWDATTRTASLPDGVRISLSALEASLLEVLLLNAGQVLTYEMVMDAVWGPGAASREMLRQLVRRLRARLGTAGDSIETIAGIGYRLAF